MRALSLLTWGSSEGDVTAKKRGKEKQSELEHERYFSKTKAMRLFKADRNYKYQSTEKLKKLPLGFENEEKFTNYPP
jgi:hypothetical protein